MKNVHKDGLNECIEYVYKKIRKSRLTFQVSIDEKGNIRVRDVDREYAECIDDEWVVGVYTRSVLLEFIEQDIAARFDEIPALSRRQTFIMSLRSYLKGD